MATGREIRANIDNENFKGLLLVNGGGSVALLTFLVFALKEPGYQTLAREVISALACYQVGLVCAVVHNRLTRTCSLIYDQHNMSPPGVPWQCRASFGFMCLSILAFLVGGYFVYRGGNVTLEQKKVAAPPVIQMPTGKLP
jgi:hypothetical protein